MTEIVAGPESRGNYNAWYAQAHQSQVQLADLRVREVRALQDRLVRRNGGSAVGRYQIIDDTLAGLVERLGLTDNERFAANLARVWAGLPGDHSDRSVYAGIQGNGATVGWRAVVASLRGIRFDGTREP